MKLYWITLVEVHVVLLHWTKPSMGDFTWKCANLSHGQQSLPDIQISTQNKEPSNIGTFYFFPLPSHLSTSCGGALSAVKYYYQYERNNASEIEAVFNWTVFIVDKDYVIVDSIAIESHPSELTCRECNGQRLYTCCDTTEVNHLELPEESFAFGVTVSAQGNTHGATLLAFHGSLSQYSVNATIIPRSDLDLTVGTRIKIENRQLSHIGLRCLWFVIDSNSQQEQTTIPSDEFNNTNTTQSTVNSVNRNHSLALVLGIGLGCLSIIILTCIAIPSILVAYRKKRKEEPANNHNYYQIEERKG